MYEVTYKELILDSLTDSVIYFLNDQVFISSCATSYDPKTGFNNKYSVHTFNVRDYSYIGFEEKLQREQKNEDTD